MFDILNFRHKDKDRLKKKTEGNNADISQYQQQVDADYVIDKKEAELKKIDNSLEQVIALKKNIVTKFSKETVRLNPAMHKELIDQVSFFQEKFMKPKIPGMPSYIRENEDGSVNVSLRLLLDTHEFLENEAGVIPINFAEEYKTGIIPSRYDMGDGYSVNSFGAVYLGQERVLNPNQISSIPIHSVDFKTKTMKLGFNNVAYGRDNLVGVDGQLKKGFNVKYENMGFRDENLKDELLFLDENSPFYLPNPTAQDYKKTPKVNFNNSDVTFISLGDFYNSYQNENSLERLVEELIKEMTKTVYLNAEVITEQDDPQKKNYMMLYLLLLIGGGQVGIKPLPKRALPCAQRLKGKRTGWGPGNEEPGGGCEEKYYKTGHNKIYDYSTSNGITTSLLQALYAAFEPFYGINLRGYTLKFNVVGQKFTFPIVPALSIGGEIEAAIFQMQEYISGEIRRFFQVRRYIKLPTLSDDGSGYEIDDYEKVDLKHYQKLQVDVYFRVNFARIFDFVEKEEKYSKSEDQIIELNSKLTSVANIYSDSAYKLKEMNTYRGLDYSTAKQMYDKGYHLLYNDNATNDGFETGMKDSNGKTYDDISPSNIWTILENNMNDMNLCDAVEISLELFDGNLYSNNVYEYNN